MFSFFSWRASLLTHWLGRPPPKYKRRWCASMCVSRRKSPKQKTPVRLPTEQPWTKVNFPLVKAVITTAFPTQIFAKITSRHFCSRVSFLVQKMWSKLLILTLMVTLSVCAPRPKADASHLHYGYGRNYHYDPYAIHHHGYEHKHGYHHEVPGHHAYGKNFPDFLS